MPETQAGERHERKRKLQAVECNTLLAHCLVLWHLCKFVVSELFVAVLVTGVQLQTAVLDCALAFKRVGLFNWGILRGCREPHLLSFHVIAALNKVIVFPVNPAAYLRWVSIGEKSYDSAIAVELHVVRTKSIRSPPRFCHI